jgi:hypothetical protein
MQIAAEGANVPCVCVWAAADDQLASLRWSVEMFVCLFPEPLLPILRQLQYRNLINAQDRF